MTSNNQSGPQDESPQGKKLFYRQPELLNHQVHGSLGYSSDMPLEMMYRSARMAPLVDGANEVHKVTIAKGELKRYEAVEGWPSEHIPTRREESLKRFAHLLEAGA